jgi:hypothetical protein
MFDYQEIKKNIKSEKVCFVYEINLNNNKFALILKSNNKSGAKNKLRQITPKNSNDYFYIILKLTFHTGTKFGQGGVIAAVLSSYLLENNVLKNILNINDKKYNYIKDNIIGPVWFTKNFIEKNGWNYNYLDNIIQKLISKKVNIKGVTLYHVKFT